MLICYLDDSGKDAQNPITTIGGYVASEEAWAEFEKEVEPYFVERHVSILHAVELHNTRGEFKGWSVLSKEAFVARIAQVASKHVSLASVCQLKRETTKTMLSIGSIPPDRPWRPTPSCFQVIVDWLLRDIRIGRRVHEEGIIFLLERASTTMPRPKRNFTGLGNTTNWRMSFTPLTSSKRTHAVQFSLPT